MTFKPSFRHFIAESGQHHWIMEVVLVKYVAFKDGYVASLVRTKLRKHFKKYPIYKRNYNSVTIILPSDEENMRFILLANKGSFDVEV